MFEYGPNGERRLSKFGQRVVFAMAMVLMVLVVTMWLVAHQRPGDSAAAVVGGGFALAGSLGMGVLTWGQGRRNEDILYQQNEKLEKIDGKLESDTSATLSAIREEWRRERHDLKGQIAMFQMKAELAEGEVKALTAAGAKLEAQIHDLTDRLARCAENKGAGDKPC